MKSTKGRGFTLIELIIVVTIIGILASIAIPSYTRYGVRNNRVAAQAALMDIAGRQTQFLLDNRRYAADLGELGVTVPAAVTKHYAVTVAAAGGPPPSFVATATPTSSGQLGDGALTINNAGVKTPADKW